MNTQQVAERLVKLCRDQKNREAVDELYADNCSSREMPGMPGDFVEGKSAIIQKTEQWFASLDQFHGGSVDAPIVAGNHFSCVMRFDVTFKERGRVAMEEIAVFEVKDGKIVAEQFFYSMG